MIGQTLGHYRIEAKLGEGGMGVVYKARDPLLDRPVAIKVLPPERVADPARKMRFMQEARSASALNHPNIITIHEINSDEGVDFIVMEYVEGRTLDQVIPKKGLRSVQALKYAVQMADALAKAHSAGILHRDLKPSNVMVTDDGRIKILDFGLAKLTDSSESRSEASTRTARELTEEGAVVGTAPYMSPEQAEGRKVDARSDIFSFGSVLYEMVTGRRPFTGESSLSIMGKIINEDPKPPSQLAAIPSELDRVILRCLRKDPARRYLQMAELKVVLEDLELEKEPEPARQTPTSRVGPLSWPRWTLVAALALIVAGAFFAWRRLGGPDRSEPLQAIPLTSYVGAETEPSFSPDGNQVAFVWTGPKQDNSDIYVQMIGSGTPLRLTTDAAHDHSPAWSPDGRWIAFLRGQTPGNSEIRLIAPLGGPERTVGNIEIRESYLPGSYLAWSADQKFFIATDSPGKGQPDSLFVVNLETGEKRRLTTPPATALGDTTPAISPDGQSLAFSRTAAANASGIYWIPLVNGLTAGEAPRPLTPGSLNAQQPAWVSSKEIVFSAQGALWRLVTSGQGHASRIGFIGQDGVMPIVSRPQTDKPARLVYVRRFRDYNVWRIDTPAIGVPALSPPGVAISSTQIDWDAQLSPDGRRVAFASGRSSDRSGDKEIWLADPDGGNAVQLTSLGAVETASPRWSPDGHTIAFDSNLEGQYEVYAIPASGGKVRRLTSHPANDTSPTFSADGRWIYFGSNRSGESQIWKMPFDGGEPTQVTQNVGHYAQESPDGAYLYYTQAATGPSPLWRMPASGGQPVKVLEGVIQRAFAVLEKGIYYIDNPERTGARVQFFDFSTGKSTIVAGIGQNISTYVTASPDGRLILYSKYESPITDLMLVENFR